MNYQQSRAEWSAHQAQLAQRGMTFDGVTSYLPAEYKRDIGLAMDAVLGLSTSANGAIHAMLTTMVDPEVLRVMFAPLKATEILSEQNKGTWTTLQAMFPVVEETGEVSSYGDENPNGRAGINANYPQRQSYHYQVIVRYGEREMDMAGEAKLQLASENQTAAANALARFRNKSYLFGIRGLQNYGLANDPSLPMSIAPSPKAAGAGNVWVTGASVINATANEVYADVQALFARLVGQSGGNVDTDTPMVLAVSPVSAVALTATNQFGINVGDLLKKNFPNLRIVTVPEYAVTSATNPFGVSGGNLAQLIATTVGGQSTGFCATNSVLRTHALVTKTSSFEQKFSAGTFGAVIKQPFAVASMIGI